MNSVRMRRAAGGRIRALVRQLWVKAVDDGMDGDMGSRAQVPFAVSKVLL